VLTTVNDGLEALGRAKAFARRPSLTVAARGVLPVAGRDEETVFPSVEQRN
jgi:hypothetical protein